MDERAAQCINCHVCQENCVFLGKYKIDIGDREQLKKLAYHCFLCGTCTSGCPQGIDGRKIILDIRRDLGISCSLPKRKIICSGIIGTLRERASYFRDAIFRPFIHGPQNGL